MINATNDPEKLLPLSSAAFNILLALSDGEERHGYGISKEVQRRTGGNVKLGPGTLYGGIKRMIAQGLIVESGSTTDLGESVRDDEQLPEAAHEQRRRYYRITSAGREVASAEARRLEGLLSTARQRGLLPGFDSDSQAMPGEV